MKVIKLMAIILLLTLGVLNLDLFFFLKKNIVDPNQLASDKVILSGSTPFSTLMEKTCLQENTVDPDKLASDNHLIRIHTVFHSD